MMKKIILTLLFLTPVYSWGGGINLRCVVSLIQQVQRDFYNVETTQIPVVIDYNSAEGPKTTLLVLKQVGSVNPKTPRFELQVASLGEPPAASIILDYKADTANVAIEMATDVSKTSSIGLSPNTPSYVQGVSIKNDDMQGFVNLACLKTN